MAVTTISIISPSLPVVKSLRALIERAGWSVVAPDDADMQLVHTPPTLQLQCGGAMHTLACPIAPQALLAALANSVVNLGMSQLPLANGWVFDRTVRALVHEAGDLPAQMLTEKESLLLAALLDASPDTVSREALLREVWSYEADIETHTLETHIYRLRQKLEALHPRPCDIETIEAAYRLVLQASPEDNL